MSQFSILIPTLFKSKRITPLVEEFERHPLVQEVVVMDNTGNVGHYKDGKLIILEGRKENYVTKSWNQLVEFSRSPYYAILNDDIHIDANILYEILDHDWTIPSIIGLDFETVVATKKQQEDVHIVSLESTEHESLPYGFGQALFGKKSQYPPIPEYLRIWCNDNYLATKLYPYLLRGAYWAGEIETSSGNPEFNDIKKGDVSRWRQMIDRGLI